MYDTFFAMLLTLIVFGSVILLVDLIQMAARARRLRRLRKRHNYSLPGETPDSFRTLPKYRLTREQERWRRR